MKSQEVELVTDEDEKNETRRLFKYIKIKNGSTIRTHLACEQCFSTFSLFDKNGAKTGSSTLKRHFNICKKTTDISEFGHLAKKVIF